MTGWLPEPVSGLPAAKSGVKKEAPNTAPGPGEFPVLTKLDAPEGLAAMGVLSKLKTSQRNWAPKRSVTRKFLNSDRSQVCDPESRKMFPPMFPKLPTPPGTVNDHP